VSVPAIVSVDLWEMANRMLDKNKGTGRRNAKEPYLLTGMIKCASCGYAYLGARKVNRKKGKEYIGRYYRDSSTLRMMGRFRDTQCTQSQISCERLDSAVWRAVSKALLEPQILIEVMERQYDAGPNVQLQIEIDYLKQQTADLEPEDEDLYRAYRAHAFDAQEFASRRAAIKARRSKLKTEIATLQGRVLTREKLELNKQKLLKQSEILRAHGLSPNPPFETKQTILKLVVEKIALNVDEGWFELAGMIPGHYEIEEKNPSIVCIPEDRGSSQPRGESSRERSANLERAQSKRRVLLPAAGAAPPDSAHRTREARRGTALPGAPMRSRPAAANVPRQPSRHGRSCGAAHEKGDNEIAACRAAACRQPNRCA
jgi:site-specific DNA recombinase